MNDYILISINAWQEEDLLQTIRSAIISADRPESLKFSVFYEGSKFEEKDFTDLNVKVFLINSQSSELFGMGLSRLVASVINDKDYRYHLQIDSHMFFEKGWDTYLKQQYNILKQKYEKPIITAYTPWWEYLNEKPMLFGKYEIDINNYQGDKNTFGTLLEINKKNIRVSPALIGSIVDWDKEENEFKEHYMISAHFMFSSPELHREILADPFITWGGDEPLYALRASTRGWKMFTVKRTILCHKNKWKSINNKNVLIPKNDWRNSVSTTYNKNNIYSDKLILDILLGKYFGYWGAPDLNSLKEYEKNIGISFSDYYQGDGVKSFSYWEAFNE